MVFNKDKSAPKPGADRMDVSRKITKGGVVVEEERFKARKNHNNSAAIVAFLFSVIFAALYSEFYINDSALLTFFDDANLNKVFFGPGYATIMADPMIDMVLIVLVRAVFFFALFGVIPFLTSRYARSRNLPGQDAYKLMWGMTAFTFFAFALLHNLLLPFAGEIMAQFQLDTN